MTILPLKPAIFLCCIGLLPTLLVAEISESSAEMRKNEKYLKILLRKPRKGYLFDRFFENWLKYSSPESLEQYLEAKYTATQKTAYLQLLAFYYEKEGKDDAALNVYDRLLALSPASPEILFNKAQLEYFEKNYRNAISDLTRALAAKPSQALTEKINKLLGKTYIRNDQPEKGLATWTQLMEQNPGNLELGEELIQLQLREGLYKAAIKTCNQLIKQSTKEFKKLMLQLQLADIYRLDNSVAEALKIYTRLIDKVGAGSWLEKELLANIENSFKEKDDLQGLSKWYKQVLKKYPSKPALNKHYARLLFDSGQTDEGLKVFRNVLSLLPSDKTSREEFVQLLLKAGKPEEALMVVNELIKNNKFDAELYLIKAEICRQLNKKEETYKALTAFINYSGKAENSYVKAARLLQSFNMKKQALSIYNAMVKQYPTSTDAAEMRLIFLYTTDQKKEALTALKKLGADINLEGLLRLTKILQSFKELTTARELLESRESEFKQNFNFNQELFSTYSALNTYQNARQPAERQLKRATSYYEISKACSNIIFCLNKTGKAGPYLKQLRAKKELSLNETCLLADLLVEGGQINQALQVIDKQLKKHPDSIILLTQKLRIYQKNYDYSNSIAVLLQLLRKQPHRKSYYTRELAMISQKAGKDRDALKWIKQWKALSPGATAPYIMESRIYESAGNLQKAIKTIQKAVRLFPENKELKFNLAGYYLSNDDFQAASDIYWRFIKQSKNLAEKVSYLKKMLSITKSRDEKEQIITKLKKYRDALPGHVFPLLALAETYKALGNQQQHHEYLKLAATNRANDIPLLKELARFAEEEGNYDQALTILQKAEKLDKSDKTSRLIAMFYLRHNEEEKGFRKLIDLLGGSALSNDALQQTILSLYKANRYDIALNLIKKNISKFADNYKLAFLYAVILEANNEIGPAIEQYLKVLEVVNNLPPFNREYKKWRSGYLRYIYVLNYYDEAKEIMLIQHLLQHSQLLSPHMSLRQAARAGWGQKSTKKNLPMPEAADEVSVYVLAHLARLNSRLTPESRKKLITELRQRKVAYPEVKLKMLQVPPYSTAFWDELHKEYPMDDVITCLWGSSLLNGSKNQTKVIEGFQKTKDKKARLAVNIVINSIDKFRNTKIDEQLIRDTIHLYDQLPERNPSVFIYRLCNFLMKQRAISNDLRQFMVNTSLDLHRNQVKGKKAFKEYYLYVYYMLLLEGKYQLLINDLQVYFSNDATTMSSFKKKSYNLFTGNLLRHSQQRLFPPANIPDFPIQVLRFFRVLKRPYGTFSSNRFKHINLNKLWQRASQIPNIGLKLLFADLCQQDIEINNIIKTIRNNKDSALPLLILAGLYEYNQGHYNSAVTFFKRALPLAMNRNLKKDLYTLIIANCRMGHTKNRELRTVGIEAIRNLSKMRISHTDRQQLVSLLNSHFSDAKAAEALAKSIPKRHKVSRPVRRQPIQQIDQLLKVKRIDEALHIALREFRKQATAYLSLPSNNAYIHTNAWQLNQLKQLLQRYQCVNRFLSKLNPGINSNSTAKLLEYAYACELFGLKQKAIETYKLVLSRNPKNRSANFRLALIMAPTHLDQAEKYLTSAIGNNINAIGIFLTSGNRDLSLPGKLALLELFMRKYKTLPNPIDVERSNWLISLLFQLENPVNFNGRLPGIFDNHKKYPLQEEALLAKRKKLYLALCDIAIKSPAKAAIVFPAKLLLLQQMGRVNNQTYNAAKEIIKKSLHNRYSRPRTSVYVNQKKVALQSPLQFVIQYATEHGKSKDLLQFINSLSGEKKSAFKNLFKAIQTLEQSSETTFIENARALLKLDIPKNLDSAHDDMDLKFSFIFMIYQSHTFKLSLTPLVLGEIKMVNQENPYYLSRLTYPIRWLELLNMNYNTQTMISYVDAVIHIIGSHYFAEKRKIQAQNHNQNILLRRLLDKLLVERSSAIFALAELLSQPSYLVFNEFFLSRRIKSIVNFLFAKNSTNQDFLNASSWLGNVADFKFHCFKISKNETVNLFKLYIDFLKRSQNRQKLNAVMIYLKSSPPLFGVRFLKAILIAKSQAAIYDVLKQELPNIKKMTKQKQQQFLKAFIAAFPPADKTNATPSWQTVIDHYKQL